jgi:starch synthase
MSHIQPFTTSSPALYRRYVKPTLASSNSPTTTSPLESADEYQQTSVKLDIEKALHGEPLRVLVVASEGVPYVKTGGPADVIGALPQALQRLGHDVRVVLPRYNSIDPERWHLTPIATDVTVPLHHTTINVRVLKTGEEATVPFYFIEAPHYFQREKLYGYNDDGDRFILFCRAALELVRAIGWSPDIIHCHDWHTAIIPNWTKTIYRYDAQFASTATVYTIHNLAYQGIFGYRILEVAGIAEEGFIYPEVPELANVVDLMGRGILFADAVSTVSPRYAQEILTPEFGERLDPLLRQRKDRLYGILNGIDTIENNPATDGHIVSHYDAFSLDQRPPNKLALQERTKLPVDPHIPLIGVISRLTDQKGFDLLDQIAVPLLEQGIQLIVSGTGDQHYHSMFQRLAARYPQQVSIHLTFNKEMSQQIYSGSDILLMPSRFEPCGSTQMLAMRYGSIPVVHRTGGLSDTVQNFDPQAKAGNGFSFAPYQPFHLFAAIVRALEAYQFTSDWRDLMQRAMLADYSWDASAEQYVALYRRAQELQRISASRR